METQLAPLDVLVVEDDAALREVLAVHLGAEGWTVRTAEDGECALAACADRRPDVVVLDVMLPGRSGLEVCATLRAKFDPSPGVVMVTARDTELDVVLGLEVGADDYVIKPFRTREVVARVRALARRVRPAPHPPGAAAQSSGRDAQVVSRGPLRIDLGSRRVTIGAAAIELTPTEFALLAFLAPAPDRVYTRLELLQGVWDSTNDGYARNVDCHVTRLRRKIERAGLDPAPIETVHGVGYRFVEPAAQVPDGREER